MAQPGLDLFHFQKAGKPSILTERRSKACAVLELAAIILRLKLAMNTGYQE